MTKSSHDVALLLDVLIPKPLTDSFTKHLTESWSDISVAVLDPDQWKSSEDGIKPVKGAEEQMVCIFYNPAQNLTNMKRNVKF